MKTTPLPDFVEGQKYVLATRHAPQRKPREHRMTFIGRSKFYLRFRVRQEDHAPLVRTVPLTEILRAKHVNATAGDYVDRIVER